VLTVVASESYKDFVAGLQREIAETLSSRLRQATEAFFTGKMIATATGAKAITPAQAKMIYRYLIKNDYTDDSDHIAPAYDEAKKAGKLAPLPDDLKPIAEQVFTLIDSVLSEAKMPGADDDRKPKANPLNENFEKKEFKELWARINHKAVYRVDFDEDELVRKSISALDKLSVTPLQYIVRTGTQIDTVTDEDLKKGSGFEEGKLEPYHGGTVSSIVKYDLVGKVAENAELTRQVAAEILVGMQPAIFSQFKQNPEHFIAEASRIITEQKATMIIERLTYDEIDGQYDAKIFTAGRQDFSRATGKLKKHIYDYAILDSNVEREFVKELDITSDVVVYAKLPRGFVIPTPVGDYNPDWAISFKEGSVKHIYFVAETKGSLSSLELTGIEKTKVDCAKKFFAEIGKRIAHDRVKYDVVTSYEKLMDIIGRTAA
jgi:type III restriction enzyme